MKKLLGLCCLFFSIVSRVCDGALTWNYAYDGNPAKSSTMDPRNPVIEGDRTWYYYTDSSGHIIYGTHDVLINTFDDEHEHWNPIDKLKSQIRGSVNDFYPVKKIRDSETGIESMKREGSKELTVQQEIENKIREGMEQMGVDFSVYVYRNYSQTKMQINSSFDFKNKESKAIKNTIRNLKQAKGNQKNEIDISETQFCKDLNTNFNKEIGKKMPDNLFGRGLSTPTALTAQESSGTATALQPLYEFTEKDRKSFFSLLSQLYIYEGDCYQVYGIDDSSIVVRVGGNTNAQMSIICYVSNTKTIDEPAYIVDPSSILMGSKSYSASTSRSSVKFTFQSTEKDKFSFKKMIME